MAPVASSQPRDQDPRLRPGGDPRQGLRGHQRRRPLRRRRRHQGRLLPPLQEQGRPRRRRRRLLVGDDRGVLRQCALPRHADPAAPRCSATSISARRSSSATSPSSPASPARWCRRRTRPIPPSAMRAPAPSSSMPKRSKPTSPRRSRARDDDAGVERQEPRPAHAGGAAGRLHPRQGQRRRAGRRRKCRPPAPLRGTAVRTNPNIRRKPHEQDSHDDQSQAGRQVQAGKSPDQRPTASTARRPGWRRTSPAATRPRPSTSTRRRSAPWS